MRQTKLPVSLLKESGKFARVHLLETESFENTFGPKKQRKRPTLADYDLDTYIEKVQKSSEDYVEDKDKSLMKESTECVDLSREWIMKAGLSKRIWGELYKVIDSSDVIIQVKKDLDFNFINTFRKKLYSYGRSLTLVIQWVPVVNKWKHI